MASELQSIYSYGVDLISILQSSFPDGESFFMDISKIFDPKYVFTIYFPIIFALQWAIGVKLLGTIIVVEWLNQVLKWLMHGDRPYWWVHEVEVAYNSTSLLPEIFQYRSTCETGPGMPSGHSMAMSAAWYVVVQSFVDRVVKPSKMSASLKQQSIQLLWAAFVVIQTLVVMSRMYIAAHFPHQCALGLFLGVSVAHQVYGSSKWLNLKRGQWLLVASVILASAIGTYSFLLLTGRNPAWSISQAYKWCAKREYIHVDTTPFYSLTRYSGAAFGLGLGLTSTYFSQTERTSFTRVQTMVTLVLGLILGYGAELAHVAIPKTNESVFYTLEFLLNVVFPYSAIALIPYAVMKSSAAKVKSL
ncbi:LOW QUALITY PROTEIN: glucose-6-phosphatase catalytic subunit 1 [Daphnia magna]|uniref:glucose-6-phosphatase n=1 Tax=Daphnia magna TaxID=35525 RepID=A0ABQ9ZDQ9_9CRUS|nr:LOW QUALITY PROTEIN: glucose-6-phosphatase catalytic subunit 1 [Daphnia magna]KAK4011046.1 hypothetical protein OUZ56_020166 [Daphnia magna]